MLGSGNMTNNDGNPGFGLYLATPSFGLSACHHSDSNCDPDSHSHSFCKSGGALSGLHSEPTISPNSGHFVFVGVGTLFLVPAHASVIVDDSTRTIFQM